MKEEELPKKKRGRKKKIVEPAQIMSGFIPSKYQQDIFDFIQHGNGNAVIKALAGTGKTATIVNAVKLIPSTCNALFIAFNKEIVKELEKKLEGVKNVQVKTLHSLGFLMIRRNLGTNIEIDEYKYRTFIKKNIKQLSSADFDKMTTKLMQQYTDNVIQLCDLGRYNLAQCEKDLLQVSARHDIPIIDDECNTVLNVMKWGRENTTSIDFTDMVWLPYELTLNPIGLQYDYIFIDESQDLNKAQRELFLRCFRRGTRFIAVGDPNQCQPAGTKVLMYDGSEKNIEDIKIGDKVITKYINSNKIINDTVTAISKREFCGKLISVNCDKYNSKYTDNHHCIVSFKNENPYILYVMCNEKNHFRIGITHLWHSIKNHSFGLTNRMLQEKCTKGWILNIYDNKKDARIDEIYYSCKYSIPQIIFNRKYIDYDELYEKLNHKMNPLGLLNEFNKNIIYPFVEKNRRNNSLCNFFKINAINLFPKYMNLLVFENNCFVIKQIDNITYINENEYVYSLNVEKTHNYISDKIFTGNCIYSFAGADAESFAKLQNLPNTTTLPLPISYRCPKKVVNLANQFVDTMECREGAPDGEIVHNVSIKDIHDGDMVLCRTKMPLIKLYMRYLRMGVKSYVRGQDIGLNLLRMVDKTEQIVLNVSLQKDGVFARLYDDLFEERNRLMIKRGMDLEDATLSNQIMNKYDSIKALEILAEGLTSARDLHDRIENVFAESADGVCLSTIHKAKGLEANNVYILCKTLMPSRLATQDWEKEQEQNLMYVAYTRAKYKLGFVSETEISPSAGMIDPSAALTELNYIENKICKLLNKTPQVIMDATEVAQYNLKSATIIEEKETNHAEISSNNNEDSDSETMKKLLELVKKKGGIEKFEKFLEQ